eukprot:gene25791-31146_t
MLRADTLCFCLLIALILNIVRGWHEAIRYDNSTFPCEAGCATSEQLCFQTAWGPVTALTRAITAQCQYVIYTVALGKREATHLHPAGDFWDGKPCSIFLLSNNSKFAETYGLETGSVFRNWFIVIVKDEPFSRQFPSARRAAKIVKFSPHTFLHSNVKYAIFIDAKLQAMVHPEVVIRSHMEQHGNVILAAVRHQKAISLQHELQRIGNSYFNYNKTGITDNYTKIVEQVEFYNRSAFMQLPYTQVMIDGGYLVHNVHDPVAIQFRCAWLNQVQLFGDRDQISLPYVVGWMTYGNTQQPGHQSNMFLSLRTDGYDPALVGGSKKHHGRAENIERRFNILNHEAYWWKEKIKTRLAKEWPRTVHDQQ